MFCGDEDAVQRARSVFERANNTMRNGVDKEDRLQILRAWQTFETEHGDETSLEKVNKLMPHLVRKRIRYVSDDGVSTLLLNSILDIIRISHDGIIFCLICARRKKKAGKRRQSMSSLKMRQLDPTLRFFKWRKHGKDKKRVTTNRNDCILAF